MKLNPATPPPPQPSLPSKNPRPSRNPSSLAVTSLCEKILSFHSTIQSSLCSLLLCIKSWEKHNAANFWISFHAVWKGNFATPHPGSKGIIDVLRSGSWDLGYRVAGKLTPSTTPKKFFLLQVELPSNTNVFYILCNNYLARSFDVPTTTRIMTFAVMQ